MTRCDHCPLAGTGLGCSGHVLGNRAICERTVDGHPHRAVTIERQKQLAARMGWTEATELHPTHDTPALDGAADPGGAAAVALLRLAKRARECPHRGCRTSCQSAACGVAKGDRRDGDEATLAHCVRCVAGATATPPAPTG